MSAPFNFTRGPTNKPVKKEIQPSERPSVGNASAVAKAQVDLNNLVINGETISIQPESITYLNIANEGVAEANKAVILNSNLGVENINEISTSELYVAGSLVTGLVNKGATVSNSIYLNGIQPGIGRENKIISSNDNGEVENVNMQGEIVKRNQGGMDMDTNTTMLNDTSIGSSTPDCYSYLKLDKLMNFHYLTGDYKKVKDLWYVTNVSTTTTVTFFETPEKINGGAFQKVFNFSNSTVQDSMHNYCISWDPVMDRYLIPIANGTNYSVNISPTGHPSTWTNSSTWSTYTIATILAGRYRAPSIKWSSLLNAFITAADSKIYSSANGQTWSLIGTIPVISNGYMNEFICHPNYIAVVSSATTLHFTTNGSTWVSKTFTSGTFVDAYGNLEYIPEVDCIFKRGFRIVASTFLSLPATGNSTSPIYTLPAGYTSKSAAPHNPYGLEYYTSNGRKYLIYNITGSTHFVYSVDDNVLQNIAAAGIFLDTNFYIFSNTTTTPFTGTKCLKYSIDFNRIYATPKQNLFIEPEVFLNFECCSRAIIRDFQWAPKINKYIAIGFANDTYATAIYANVCLYHSDDLVNFKFIRDLQSTTINKLVVEEETGFVYCMATLGSSVMIFSNYGDNLVSTYTQITSIKYAEYCKYYGYVIIGSSSQITAFNSGVGFSIINLNTGFTFAHYFAYSNSGGTSSVSGHTSLLLFNITFVSNSSSTVTDTREMKFLRNFKKNNRYTMLLGTSTHTLPVFIEELGIIVRIRNSSSWDSTMKISYGIQSTISSQDYDWTDIPLSSAYFQNSSIWTPSLKYDTNSGRLFIIGNSDLQRTKISTYNLSLDQTPFMKNHLSSYYSRDDSGEELMPLETISASSYNFSGLAYSSGLYVACSNNNLHIGNKIKYLTVVSTVGNWNSISSSLSHFVVVGNNKLAVASVEMNNPNVTFNILNSNGLEMVNWKSVYYSDQLKTWAICGDGKWAFSDNAVNWTIIDVAGVWSCIKYLNGYWVGIGLNNIGYTNTQLPSSLTTITKITLSGDWRDIDFGGRWVITGFGKTMATTSYNSLTNWEVLAPMNNRNFNSILFVESLNQYVLLGEHCSVYIQSNGKFLNPSGLSIIDMNNRVIKSSMWSERYKSIIMVGDQFIIGSRMLQAGLDNTLNRNGLLIDSSSLSSNTSFLKVSNVNNGTNKSDGYLSVENTAMGNNLVSLKNTTTNDVSEIYVSNSNTFNVEVGNTLHLDAPVIKINSNTLSKDISFLNVSIETPGVVESDKFITSNSSGGITSITSITAGGLIIDDELYSNIVPITLENVVGGVVSANKAVKLNNLKNIEGINSLKTNNININGNQWYSKSVDATHTIFSNEQSAMDGGTYNLNDCCYSSYLKMFIALPSFNGVSTMSAEVEKGYILLSKDGKIWYKSYTGLNTIFRFAVPFNKISAAVTERKNGLLLFSDSLFGTTKAFYTPDCINFYPYNYTLISLAEFSSSHSVIINEGVGEFLLYNPSSSTARLLGLGGFNSPSWPATGAAKTLTLTDVISGLVNNSYFIDAVSASPTYTSITTVGTVNHAAFIKGLSGTGNNLEAIYVATDGRVFYKTTPTTSYTSYIPDANVVVDANCNFTKIVYNQALRRCLITATNGRIFISNIGSRTVWTEVMTNKPELFNFEWSNIRACDEEGFILWHSDNSNSFKTASKICTVNANGEFIQGYQSFRRTYGLGDYGNGLYVIPINEGGWGDKIAYSSDGISWDFSLYANSGINKIVFFKNINKFIASSAREIFTSENGKNWTKVYTHTVTSASAFSMVYMEDRGMIAILFYNTSTKQFIYSSDCQSWNEVDINSPFNNTFNHICYSPELSRVIVCVNESNVTPVLYSDNLTTFSPGVNVNSSSTNIPRGRNMMWIKEGAFFCMFNIYQNILWFSNDGINWRVDTFLEPSTGENINLTNGWEAMNSIYVPEHGDLLAFGYNNRGNNIFKVSNQYFKMMAPINSNSDANDYNILIYNSDKKHILAYKNKEGNRKGDVFHILDLEEFRQKNTKEICVDYINKLYNDKLPIEDYINSNNLLTLTNSTLDGGAQESATLISNYSTVKTYTSNLDSVTPTNIFWCQQVEMLFITTSNGVVRTENGVDFVICCSNFVATSICYSPELSLLVAVKSSGTGGRIATSSNGIDWTIINSTNDTMLWNKVVWASGLNMFVACSQSTGAIVGDANKFMTSPDGIAWTSRAPPNNSLGYISVEYSPSLNVLTSLSTTVATGAYSLDGINWVANAITGANNTHKDIVWVSKYNLFLSVSGTTTAGALIKSVDGINWTSIYTSSTNFTGITWCEEIESIAITSQDGTNRFIMSNNLIDWLVISDGRASSNFSKITWSAKFNSVFICYNGGVNCVVRYVDYKSTLLNSYDVINSSTWTNVCWSPSLNLFVAVSSSGKDQFANSSNGSVWNKSNYSASKEGMDIRGICWSTELNLFVAVSRNGINRVLTSANGTDWTSRSTPGGVNNSWTDICWSKELNLFVAVANAGVNRVMTSGDGINWSVPASVSGNLTINSLSYLKVCWSKGLNMFIATSNSSVVGNNIIKSFDGIVWFVSTSLNANLRSICWSEELGMFVAISTTGTNKIMTSTNGELWTVRVSMADDFTLENIIWTGAKFVIVGCNNSNFGVIVESRNGLLWNHIHTTAAINNFQAVAYSSTLNEYAIVANVGTDRITNVTNAGLEQPITNSSLNYKESLNVVEYVPADTARNWTDVIYVPALKRLVACADNGATSGKIMTSDNFGGSWSSGTTLSASSLSSIAYGSFSPTYKFLVVNRSATNNSMLLNTTGVASWVTTTPDSYMECACASEELRLFVVVKSSGVNRVITSPDATTWTYSASADETAQWSSIVWAPSIRLFVAVARSGDSRVMTSSNGTTWTARTLSDGLELCAWNNICWSEKMKMFIAVSTSGDFKMMKSADGINWSAISSSSFTSSIKKIIWCYGADMFMGLLSSGSERIVYSRDAVNWFSFVGLNDTTNWNSICWIPDINSGIAVSNATSKIMRITPVKSSISSIKPIASINDSTSSWNSITWSEALELYVAVASAGVDRIMISDDAVTWSAPTTVPAGVNSNSWNSVVWSSQLNLFVAVASTGTNRIITSADGLIWSILTSTVANTSAWMSITWSAELSMFVAVANSGVQRIIISADGIDWTTRTNFNHSNGWSFVYWVKKLSMFVALADSGTNRIMISLNGLIWNAITMPTGSESNAWKSVCWSKELNKLVAVAYSGTGSSRVIVSNDGVNWFLSTSTSYVNFTSIVWAKEINLFVGVGSTGANPKMMTSADGLVWNYQTSSNDNNSWNCIIWNAGRNEFIAVAAGGSNRVMKILVDRNNITPSYVNYERKQTIIPANYLSYTVTSAVEVNSWISICWSPELSLFAAVSRDGTNRVMTSPNGITWTARVSAGEANQWFSICWSSELSLFVAVAASGTNRVMTSLDGITWTARLSASEANEWYGVCWSPQLSLFVAVAYSGTNRVMTSSNGISWSARVSAVESNGWFSICWSPELSLFVVVSRTGTNRVMTSPDGITWTPRVSASEANEWRSVCWSPQLSLFVAVSLDGSKRVMTSVNGITWISRSSSSETNGWYGVCWSPELSLFTAVSSSGTNRVMTSVDGINWTPRLSGSETNSYISVCWSPQLNVFAAVAYAGTNRAMIIISNSQTTNTPLLEDNTPSEFTVPYTTTLTVPPSRVLNSTSYARVSSGETNEWFGICFSEELGLFVAVASSGANSVMTSVNGINWTGRASSLDGNAWRSVCWSPSLNLFAAVSISGTNRVMTSVNGITWSPRVSAVEANSWNSVCWSPQLNLFVAVSTNGTNRVMTSVDGITWTPRVSAGETNSWYSVCWSPTLSLFASVSYDGTNRVMTSPDGINWTMQTSTASSSWYSICWGSTINLFVAVAGTGTNRVMTSPDGITWTIRTSIDGNAWNSVCWGEAYGLFLATGYSGSSRVMTSPDGITWTARASSVESNSWYGVCYSNALKMFCAVSYTGSNRVMNITEYTQLTSSAVSALTGETNSWKSICYSEELSLFVAVSSDGVNRVMTSTDGTNWIARLSAAEGNGWSSVCWSSQLSLFVAVASSGTNRMMSSVDGITWVSYLTSGESNEWYSVCWSPSLNTFVSVSITGTNRVMTIMEIKDLSIISAIGVSSVDGNEWRSVCWSEEESLFLSVASSGSKRIMSSADGVYWYPWKSSGETNEWQDVCWGKKLTTFASVSSTGTNRLMTSQVVKADRFTPTGSLSAGETNGWQDVCWSEELSMFVAVANSGTNRAMTSDSGIAWTPKNTGTTGELNEWSSVCWSPKRSLYVVVANEGVDKVMNINQIIYKNSAKDLRINGRVSAVESNYWANVCWSPQLSIFVAVAVTGSNRVMTSVDGITWTARVSAGESNEWRSVCWSPALSLFVAVAGTGTGRVMTSPDGITWTTRTSTGEGNQWHSVCWSPQLSLFVAVAYNGTNRVMTSGDGITWTLRVSAVESNYWSGVCWSPTLSLFVAVAQSGTNRVMTSTNGINWSARVSSGESNNWFSICWSEELSLFVAVASVGTNRVMTSPNGITWTSRVSAAEGNAWHNVCWSKELSVFVAVAFSGTNLLMISEDGINWSSRISSGEANSWKCVCWNPQLNVFVAVAGSGTNRVMTIAPPKLSVSDISIVGTVSAVEGNNWNNVCWSPQLSLFVAVAYLGTNRVMTSTDGINWTPGVSAVETNGWYDVCWSPELSLFVAVAFSGTNRVMTSVNGITWIARTSAVESNQWLSVCWSQQLSLFVAIAASGTGRVMTSPDGITWTARTSAEESNNWINICWSPQLNLFVAVANTGANRVMTSVNGITWIARTSAVESNQWLDVCWSPELSLFVAVAVSGTNSVMTSPDGITWTARVSAVEGNGWNNICWSPELDLFVAIAHTGINRVMTSPDGITWTSYASSNESNLWRGVCWSPQLNMIVAVAPTGTNRVMHILPPSPSQFNIVSKVSAVEANSWRSVCWSPTLDIFVAVASSGDNRVMTSAMGDVWTSRLSAVETNGWWSVCWSTGLSLFVAVAISGDNRVMTSPDGITWTAILSAGETNEWRSVCWSPKLSLLVAVASSGDNRVMTSGNGITWTAQVSAVETNSWYKVVWFSRLSLFVAVSSDGVNRIMTSVDGITWIPKVSSGESNSWMSICDSPSLEMTVAVASSGSNRVMNMTGENIGDILSTARLSSGESNEWRSICYSESKALFVAVASSGSNRVMTYGENAIEMVRRTSANEGNYWNDICWSPQLSLFVVVASGGSNLVMTSPDGITWTPRASSGESNEWRSVCWSPQLGLFVAVAYRGTNLVMTSPNGITWTPRVSAHEGLNWCDICWSPQLSLFVAVNASSGGVMTSPNGTTWTARSSWGGWSVCWSPQLSLFVIVSSWGGITTSSNGITWTSLPPVGVNNIWSSVCWSPELSLFVAVSNTGTNRVMTSPNGINWTQRVSAGETNSWYSVCWSSELSLFVAVAQNGTNRVMISLDGITWTAYASSTETNAWYGVCWSPQLNLFTAVSYTGTNRVMTITVPSNNQIVTKPRLSAVETNNWWGVCRSEELNLFVAVASSGSNRVMTSVDGINWNASTSALETNSWRSICWSPQLSLFVAVSSDGVNRVMTSVDGITWTIRSGGLGNWQSVKWSAGLSLFIAVANLGTNRVMTSANGIIWSVRTSSVESNSWNSICWSPQLSKAVAVSTSGTNRVMNISDLGTSGLKSESRLSAVESNTWLSVCWSPTLSLFVAVSNSGTSRVMTSGDGCIWTARTSSVESNQWRSVCWSPQLSLFVAVSASGSNRVMTSVDGITWTARTSAVESNAWVSVAWSSKFSMFVAIAESGANRVMASMNGITWSSIKSSGESNGWSCICSSNNQSLLAAVSSSGVNRITNLKEISYIPVSYSTSITSINRITAPLDTTNQWCSMVWSQDLGLFVALSFAGTDRVMTSGDGLNWTVRPSPSTAAKEWVGACWSDKLKIFVAVSTVGSRKVAVSSDGIRWNAVLSSNESGAWRSVCWSSELNMFLAVGSASTSRVMYSYDGINWTGVVSSNESAGWHGVCWSAELHMFIALADNGSGNRIMRSSNGINWTDITLSPTNVWCNGVWSPYLKLFVIVARGGTNRIAYSSNGIDWTQIESPLETASWRNIIWIPEIKVFIATAETGHIMESFNGINWRLRSSQGTNYGSIAWSPLLNKCIAGSWSLTGRITEINFTATPITPSPASITSYDLGTFNNNFAITSTTTTSIAYSNTLGLYVGVCSTGSRRLIYSYDAVQWNTAILTSSSLNSSSWKDVCWNTSLSLFVAVAISGTDRIALSSNGMDWTAIAPTGFSNVWNSITSREAVMNGEGAETTSAMIIAVSNNGVVLRSINGVDWVVAASGNTNGYQSIIYNGGKFVAVANSGTNRSMYSLDGLTWTTSAIAANAWIDTSYSSSLGLFVSVSSTAGVNSITTSLDGIAWSAVTLSSPSSTATWSSVCRSEETGIFVAISNNNVDAAVSTDGINWISKRVSFDTKLLTKITWNKFRNEFILSSNSTAINSSVLQIARPPSLALSYKVKWDLIWSKSIQMFMAFKKSDPLVNDNQLLISPNGRVWTADTNFPTAARTKAITSYTEIANFGYVYMCRNTPQVQYIGSGGIGVTTVNGFNINCVFYSNSLGVLIMGASNSSTLLTANVLRTGGLDGMFINTTLPAVMTVKDIALCNGNHLIIQNGEVSSYYYSYDLNTFTLANLPSKAEWHFSSKISYGSDGTAYSGVLVGVSSTGIVIRSIDGINWSTIKNYNVLESSGSRKFSNLKYIEEFNVFVAVDEVKKTNCVIYSLDDGLTWSDITLDVAASISDISFSSYLDTFLFLSLPDSSSGNLTAITTLPKLPAGGNILKTNAFNVSPNGGLYTGEIITNTFLSNTLETLPLLALSTNSAYKPSTSTWTINSDERLKENIENMDIDECLDLIDRLNLKYYKWKDEFSDNVQEEDKHKLGFIAQEVGELMPDAVYDIGSMYGYENVKTINQDQLIAVLYGSIQKLMSRYESLKEELESM
jgi:hypothetical protein